jgi:hypothetical protein
VKKAALSSLGSEQQWGRVNVNRRLTLLVVLASVVLSARFASAARADVALCGSFPPPPSDAKSLRQAPFAFDGVAIRGRGVEDQNGDVMLVSPITFRVTRWLKHGSASTVASPSGTNQVTVWDGRYARLPAAVLGSTSLELTNRFPGEIRVFPGQAWRVYGTNENRINFTCTNLLGSHPIPQSEPESSAAPTRPPFQTGTSGRNTRWVVLLVALLALSTLMLTLWRSTGPRGRILKRFR